jgi:6-phosphogluconolactonase
MAVHDSPKPPPDRVSLTPQALTQSERLLVLLTGGGKADVVRRWRQGEALPVARVAMQGRSLVYLDRAAAGLSRNR